MTWMLIPDQLSCRFAPASERWTSESSSPLEPELWATSSGTPTARRYSWRGWKMRAWSPLLWSRLWRDSPAGDGLDAWTSSLRASRANRSATPESDSETRTNEPSGPRSPGSSRRSGPGPCSSRTSPGLLFEDPTLSFNLWASQSIRRAWRLPRNTGRQTFANGGLCSLPTPIARDWKSGEMSDETAAKNSRPLNEIVTALPTPTSSNSTGPGEHGEGGDNLQTRVHQLPTPSASQGGTNQGGAAGRVGPVRPQLETLVRNLPSATAGDANASGSAGYSTESGRHSGTTLTDAVLGAASAGRRGQLSPRLSEWILGLPDGWSDYESLATSGLRRWSTLTRCCLWRHMRASR